MLTNIPDPLVYPYDRCEVWEPAPYCKLVYDDPIYHRGIRFCLMFRIPQLLPLVPIRLEKKTIGYSKLIWRPVELSWWTKGLYTPSHMVRASYRGLRGSHPLKEHVDAVDLTNPVIRKPQTNYDELELITLFHSTNVKVRYVAERQDHTITGWVEAKYGGR